MKRMLFGLGIFLSTFPPTLADEVDIQFQYLCEFDYAHNVLFMNREAELKRVTQDEGDIHFRITRRDGRDELFYYNMLNGYIFRLERQPATANNKNLLVYEDVKPWGTVSFTIRYIAGPYDNQLLELRRDVDTYPNIWNGIYTCRRST